MWWPKYCRLARFLVAQLLRFPRTVLSDLETYNRYDETILNLVWRACAFRALDDSIQCEWKRYAIDYS